METVISRSEWGATEPRTRTKVNGIAKRVIVHHTSMKTCTTPQDCKAELNQIQRMHMSERDFDDIGYNFLVGQNGMVYEGRGWGVMGAHAKGHNRDSVGVAFMGNFNRDIPSSAAILAVKGLLRDGVSRGWLHPNYTILGHRDVGNTDCPGHQLYPEMHKLRSQ